MIQVKLIIVDVNADFDSLGLFDLDVIPRTGEYIWHERTGDDGPKPYLVKQVNHLTEPKSPTEIWLQSHDVD